MSSVKRQRSIFEFRLSKRVHSEVVDLTNDTCEDVALTDDPEEGVTEITDVTEISGHIKEEANFTQFEETKAVNEIKEIDEETTLKDEEVTLKDEFKMAPEFAHKRSKSPIKPVIQLEFHEEALPTHLSDEVLCPICSISILALSLDFRTKHVERCLLESMEPTKDPKELKKEQAELKQAKAKQAKADLQEASKYMNKQLDYDKLLNKETEIKHPKSVRSSSGKRPIPMVKTLSFDYIDRTYKVSVDAFSFKPNSEIDQNFLTHFHADHYGGISKNWCYERVFSDLDFENDSKYKQIIYCTVITSKLLTLRFGIDPRFIKEMELETKYKVKNYLKTEALWVTPITANHCPGAAIFLFESECNGRWQRYLHCGDFRVNKEILCHPLLSRFNINSTEQLKLDKVYLDTTYLSPNYNFPKQELVCLTLADFFFTLTKANDSLSSTWFGMLRQSRITDFLGKKTQKKKILILVGSYLIGKEKLAIAILHKLKCGLYVLNVKSRTDKLKILKSYKDPLLDLLLTQNDRDVSSDCLVHLVPMNIVSNTTELASYFNDNKYFEIFERCIGVKPTGWTFLSPYAKPAIDETWTTNQKLNGLLKILEKVPPFTYEKDVLPQYPMHDISKKRKVADLNYRTYAVPYSEHSSFRELSYFTIFFNVKQMIPTVNIENSASIDRMTQLLDLLKLARDVKYGKEANIDKSLLEQLKMLTLDNF